MKNRGEGSQILTIFKTFLNYFEGKLNYQLAFSFEI